MYLFIYDMHVYIYMCVCVFFNSRRCKRGCPLKTDCLTIWLGIENISNKNVILPSHMGSILCGIVIRLESSCSQLENQLFFGAHEDPGGFAG